MEAPLVIAGALALMGAVVHGGAGAALVLTKLSADDLPATRLGGPGMTKMMIDASWHLTTVAFIAGGCALILSGTVLDPDEARPLALVAAFMATGFAAVVLGLGALQLRSARFVFRHPGPPLLTLTAALALWGALAL